MQTVYTIGHSNRTADELVEILTALGVSVLIDVRRYPTSRRHPHFNAIRLSARLSSAGIDYVWIGELGGYRKFGVDVDDHGIARCFESEGFRAYATYITTSKRAREWLELLVRITRSCRCAIMCSENLPWRCHRKILSDYLVVRGFKVLHYVDGRLIEHKLSSCANVINGELTYL